MRRLLLFAVGLSIVGPTPAFSAPEMKLVFEGYNENNWDLYLAGLKGDGKTNLTNTVDQNELYPQVSPDGRRICFLVEQGSGRETIRSIWLMDIDGSNRRKVADYARQPCWAPDSKTILYLPQEFKKFNVADFFTKGIAFYDIETNKSRPHPNSEQLHHLYNPTFSANGKWIVSTVHAGMGYKHAILAIEANGSRIIDLKIPGCRPCLSSDGKRVAWGADDHTLIVAELDTTAETPVVGKRLFHVRDSKNKIYHADLSPDGKLLGFSRGPNGKGDPSKPGTHRAACEIVGVYATNWNVVVTPIRVNQTLNLDTAKAGEFETITTDGLSNKEPDFFISQ